jgi:hypothetical protein
LRSLRWSEFAASGLDICHVVNAHSSCLFVKGTGKSDTSN